MNLYDHESYKTIVTEYIQTMPKKGYGQFRKLSQHLRVHTTLMTQIFKGTKDLTLEQASLVCDYFGWSEDETEYFVTLVEWERAGNESLRNILIKRIQRLRLKGEKVAAHIGVSKELSDVDKSVYYSNWYYGGIRILSSVEKYQTIDEIAGFLNLPRALVSRVTDFLVLSGLCIKKGGKIFMSAKSLHLEPDSHYASQNHTNWRMKAMQNYPTLSHQDLAYTSVVTVSESDFPEIREKLVEVLAETRKTMVRSQAERLACLNVDWFFVKS